MDEFTKMLTIKFKSYQVFILFYNQVPLKWKSLYN